MTDEQWLACDSPARMRGEIRSRPFSGLRWVLFDLACVHRIRDLLGPRAQSCIDELSGLDDFVLRHAAVAAARDVVREEIRSAWTCRTDPLREAKVAAMRAVLSLGSHTLATSEMVCVAAGRRAGQPGLEEAVRAERRAHAALVRCVFRSTLSPVAFSPAWRTDTVVALVEQMRRLRDYAAMPILADALQDAGCDSEAILTHCRCEGPHARGCWVVDLVRGKV